MVSPLKIFVASGADLKAEREKMASFVEEWQILFPKYHLQIVRWETHLAPGSGQEKIQERINRDLKECQIVLVLIYGKLGQYTRYEFDLAQKLKLKTFVFFKEGFSPKNPQETQTLKEVLEFKEQLIKDSNILFTPFKTKASLKAELKRALELHLQEAQKQKPRKQKQKPRKPKASPQPASPAPLSGERNPKYLTSLPRNLQPALGRQAELQRITEHFQKPGVLLLLHGLGGIGKTTLAREFWAQQETSFDFLAWVGFQGSLADSLLYPFLGHPDFQFPENHAQAHLDLLAKLRELPGRKLMILDNCDEVQAVKELADALPGWCLLVTGRQKMEDIVPLTLETLADPEARALFHRHCTKTFSEANLSQLLQDLTTHTLLIELAAKTYEKSLGLTPTALLERFRPRAPQPGKDSLLEQRLRELYDLAQLDSNEQLWLRRLALFPPQPIPFDLLCQLCGQESEEQMEDFRTLLEHLAASGWLVAQESDCFVHPLIQRCLFLAAPPDLETARLLIQAIAKRLNYLPQESPLDKQIYVPYGLALLEALPAANDLDLAGLCHHLANIDRAAGQWQRAKEEDLRALAIRQRLLPENAREIAASYNQLNLDCFHLDQYQEAKIYVEQAIAIGEATLPPEHPDLATRYHNLASIHWTLKELELAQNWLWKAIQIYEEALAPDPSDLASSYDLMALIYDDLGNPEEAKTWALKALQIREQVFPSKYPDLASSYHNFSAILRSLEEWEEAEKYAQQAVEIREAIFQPEHPHLALARENLARAEARVKD